MESTNCSVLSALLAVGLLILAPQGLRAQDEGATTLNYRVQPSDMLQVSVWREEGLNQNVLVRPDGGISFPLAGDMLATGRTVEQIRLELAERLSRYIPDPVVTVTVTEINGNKIYVIGQVVRPGPFIMNPSVDVVQALSMAGGMTPFAAVDDIFVLRRTEGRQNTLPFRFSDVSRGRNLEQNIILQSGDVVIVP